MQDSIRPDDTTADTTASSSTRKRALTSVGVAVGVFLLFGTVTGLVPNPLYVRMVPRTPLDYLFLVATSVFAGAFVYQRATLGGSTNDRTAFGGVVGGFLAFGCPTCNVVLLALFGSSALMTYVDPLRPLLGAVSVALFAGLLYVQRRRGCRTC
ncbi:hypothetical protein [Natronosalvus halobius]|uniref:hypothetical protein n=1 Tax=Natronosalvus halobius TaxID=2953746 RepID=UPI00209F9D08|nr:hypothetical protein [Natronosalvus halobius]USZ71796.1 hypothetical protein NGM15_00370 [Natronosalvus halobius]